MKIPSVPSLPNLLDELWAGVQTGWAWALDQLGITWWELTAIIIAFMLFRTFFGKSGIGRGRRYRRGYSVAYREERGKLAARRAESHIDQKDSQ